MLMGAEKILRIKATPKYPKYWGANKRIKGKTIGGNNGRIYWIFRL
jgi:hypothetical protein